MIAEMIMEKLDPVVSPDGSKPLKINEHCEPALI